MPSQAKQRMVQLSMCISSPYFCLICCSAFCHCGQRLSTLILCFKRQNSCRSQKPNSWTYNFVEVSGHNLESSSKQISFKPLLWRGGGVKFVSRGDCKLQEGKLVKLLSKVRPRIPPLFWSGVWRTVEWTLDLPLYTYSLPRWSQVTCHRGGGRGVRMQCHEKFTCCCVNNYNTVSFP